MGPWYASGVTGRHLMERNATDNPIWETTKQRLPTPF